MFGLHFAAQANLLIFYVLIQIISSSLLDRFNITGFYNKDKQNLIIFATKAYHLYCEHCRATLIIHDDKDATTNMFLKRISRQEFNMSIVSISLKQEEERPWLLHGEYSEDLMELTIIFWNQRFFQEVRDFLDDVEHLPYWNRYSKILIVLTSAVPDDYIKWIKGVFHLFWTRKTLRVFICFTLDSRVRVFMYNPFLADYAVDISDSTDEEFNVYLEYELLDLYGYPMKTYVYDLVSYKERCLSGEKDVRGHKQFVGIDGKFLTEVRNILNCSLDVHRETETASLNKFFKYVDEEDFSTRNFIHFYDFDIWFTAIKAIRHQGVDYVFLHERDDLCFVVPSGKPVPQYLYIFLIVPGYLWLATTISFIVVTLMLWLLKSRHAFLDTYRMFLNIPIPDIDRWKPNSERLVLTSWMEYAFIFSAVFQCTLMSTLIARKYYPDMNTINDLLHTNLTIYSGKSDLYVLEDNTPYLLNHVHPHDEWTIENMILHHKEDIGFMVRTEIARGFLKILKHHSGGTARFHIMSEHPLPSAQAYVMPKGHPYYEEMIWMINKVHESGLYYLWRRTGFGWNQRIETTNNKTEEEDSIHFEVPSNEKFVPLSMRHLQSVFYVFMVGQTVSFMSFLTEIFIGRNI